MHDECLYFARLLLLNLSTIYLTFVLIPYLHSYTRDFRAYSYLSFFIMIFGQLITKCLD